jgi:hypothetical protein
MIRKTAHCLDIARTHTNDTKCFLTSCDLDSPVDQGLAVITLVDEREMKRTPTLVRS